MAPIYIIKEVVTPDELLVKYLLRKECRLPEPMPLTTAPSVRPVVTALLVGALWGARLGRNRQLVKKTHPG